MNGTRSALALSAALLFLAGVASVPGAPSAAPASTTPSVASGEGGKVSDLPRVEVVAQAVKPSSAATVVEVALKGADAPPAKTATVAVADKPDIAFMTLAELHEALDCAKQDVAAIQEEIDRRTPKKAPNDFADYFDKRTVKASTCDPNCQCATTGVCTCGPDCPCTCPKAEVSQAPANFTEPEFVTVEEPVYEDRVVVNRGPWGVPRPFLLGSSVQRVQSGTVSRTYATSPTMLPTGSVKSVTTVSSAPVVTYQSSPARVQSVQSRRVVGPSTSGYYAPSGSTRRVCSGGRCYLVPQ